MDYGSVNKFDYARRVAAAVAYIGICNLDRVSLTVNANGKEHTLSDIRGKKQVFRLFAYLSKIKPEGKTDLKDAVRRFVLRHRRPGVMLLVSDFLDPNGYEEPSKTLAGPRMDLFAIQVRAEEEGEPV